MVRVYTDIWNGFQFRAPAYLDGHFEPYEFDLVKWVKCEPLEVTDMITGEKRMSSEYCFSIGKLVWYPRDEYFGFSSHGLRYLEHRVDGLEKFILDFCETMDTQLSAETL